MGCPCGSQGCLRAGPPNILPKAPELLAVTRFSTSSCFAALNPEGRLLGVASEGGPAGKGL